MRQWVKIMTAQVSVGADCKTPVTATLSSESAFYIYVSSISLSNYRFFNTEKKIK